MEEIWKSVSDWEGKYEVSSLGRVRSLDRKIKGRVLGYFTFRKGRVLKLKKLVQNSYMVAVMNDNKIFYKLVHRLVALAFIPNPKDKPCVNHIDNNPQNNHVSNLEWCTQKENVQHAYRQGRWRGSKKVLANSHFKK